MYFYFNLGEGICVCYLFRLSSPLCFISIEHSTGQAEYVLSTQSLYPSCPCLPGRTKHSYSHTQVTANHQCPLLTRTQEMHYHIRLCGRLPHAQLQTFCKLGAGCCHTQLPHQRDISIFSGLIFLTFYASNYFQHVAQTICNHYVQKSTLPDLHR